MLYMYPVIAQLQSVVIVESHGENGNYRSHSCGVDFRSDHL